MTSDEYVNSVLAKYQVQTGQNSPAFTAANAVYPVIQEWAGKALQKVTFSGSYAKGTGVKGTTDVDLFISLKSSTTNTLKEIFNSLYSHMNKKGYSVRKQNVSIHVVHNSIEIDLVPGVNQIGNTNDHWLYVNKSGRERTQTNMDTHIDFVKSFKRINEIRAIKIWRKLNNLDFPSFYLELAVIEALKGYKIGNLADNVLRALDYLRDDFVNARLVDPANTNNIISDEELNTQEKEAIAEQARVSRSKKTWGDIIW